VGSKCKAPKDALEIRRIEALRLRVSGLTYEAIAEELGVSLGTAHSDVQFMLAKRRKQAAEDAEHVRELELERLDAAIYLVLGQIGKENLGAVDRLVKLNERRCKMLGLDAPEQRKHSFGDGGPTPADVAKLVRAKFGSVGPESEEEEAENRETEGPERPDVE
jgi:predicted DNA-binding protein (UPF0251 family)